MASPAPTPARNTPRQERSWTITTPPKTDRTTKVVLEGSHGEEMTKLERLGGEGVESRGQQTGGCAIQPAPQEEEEEDGQRVQQGHHHTTGEGHSFAGRIGTLHERDGSIREWQQAGRPCQIAQQFAGEDAKIEGKMAVGIGAAAVAMTIPQGVERAALGIAGLVERGWQFDRGRVETGGTAFVGVCVQPAIKVDVPGAQTQPGQHDNAKKEVYKLR